MTPGGGRQRNSTAPILGRTNQPPYYVARRKLTDLFRVFDSQHLWPGARPICSSWDFAEAQTWARKGNEAETH